jgi:uncharacterized protein
MTAPEVRYSLGTVEFRAKGRDIRAAGYASVFGKPSENLGGFVEQVAPGAFRKTISERDVLALYNHDPNLLLGRSHAGTLRLEEDKNGLAYEIDLPDTTVGRDLASLLERGDLRGSSFGFRTIKDSWSETEAGYPLRTLEQVALFDVGPVVNPAYPDTTAAVRSLASQAGVDLDVVREAAARDELRTLIGEKQPEDDDRATPIVIRRPALIV